jgi:glutamyl-Q tRNA(Asp) synthetase
VSPPAYVGRFAPSPTGPLHAGSLVAALASWLDARAHGGQWLVRIEDVDTPRCVPGADAIILHQLTALGLIPDAPPVYQSQRGHLYQVALDTLVAQDLAYPCACTRADIAQANALRGLPKARHAELIYPGTCRPENGGLRGREARAWRLRIRPRGQLQPSPPWTWQDRRLGPQTQSREDTVGDFVIRRADGLWAYQLAVVVDDAAQGVTHVVRGEDLADNTPRQQWLTQCLGLPALAYLHTPLVLDSHGEKLSKQHGALPLDTDRALDELSKAGQVLGIHSRGSDAREWLANAVSAWVLP